MSLRAKKIIEKAEKEAAKIKKEAKLEAEKAKKAKESQSKVAKAMTGMNVNHAVANLAWETLKESLLMTKEETEIATKVILTAIHQVLVKNGKVDLPKMGVLKVKKRNARKGMNIVTKEPIEIPEHNTVVFSVNKQLKKAVN